MKCVTLDPNTNIIVWSCMESGRVDILDNQFGGSYENVQQKVKVGRGTNNLCPKVLNVSNNNIGKLNDTNNM